METNNEALSKKKYFGETESINTDLLNAEGIFLITSPQSHVLKKTHPRLAEQMLSQLGMLENNPNLSEEKKLFRVVLTINLMIYYHMHNTYYEKINYLFNLRQYHREICEATFLNCTQKAAWSAQLAKAFSMINNHEYADEFYEMAIGFHEGKSSLKHRLCWLKAKLTHIHRVYLKNNLSTLHHQLCLQAIDIADSALQLCPNSLTANFYYYKASVYEMLTLHCKIKKNPEKIVKILFMAIVTNICALKYSNKLNNKKIIFYKLQEYADEILNQLNKNEFINVKENVNELDVLIEQSGISELKNIIPLMKLKFHVNKSHLLSIDIDNAAKDFLDHQDIPLIYSLKCNRKNFIKDVLFNLKELERETCPETAIVKNIKLAALTANLLIYYFKIDNSEMKKLYLEKMGKYYWKICENNDLSNVQKAKWSAITGKTHHLIELLAHAATYYQKAISYQKKNDDLKGCVSMVILDYRMNLMIIKIESALFLKKTCSLPDTEEENCLDAIEIADNAVKLPKNSLTYKFYYYQGQAYQVLAHSFKMKEKPGMMIHLYFNAIKAHILGLSMKTNLDSQVIFLTKIEECSAILFKKLENLNSIEVKEEFRSLKTLVNKLDHDDQKMLKPVVEKLSSYMLYPPKPNFFKNPPELKQELKNEDVRSFSHT